VNVKVGAGFLSKPEEANMVGNSRFLACLIAAGAALVALGSPRGLAWSSGPAAQERVKQSDPDIRWEFDTGG
jgi:hypothetical protein